jgi:hypothetical protein
MALLYLVYDGNHNPETYELSQVIVALSAFCRD